MTTRVAVNLLWCLPGQVGGSEDYLTRTLAGLSAVPHDLELVLYVLPGFAIAHPALANRHRLVVAPVTGERRAVRVAVEKTWFRRELARVRPHVVHHGGGTLPLRRRGTRAVVTLHDVQYLTYPRYFSFVKRLWLDRQVPVALRRADVVTTPSAYVASTLVDRLGADPAKLVVVPHGLPPGFAVAPVDEAGVRARYGVPDRFVLYPAATFPHKNHPVLVDAFARLGPGHEDVRLVLIGAEAAGEADLQARIAASGVAERIVRPGRVPEADRDALVRLATVVAFPSRYEGFGAPAIEAMASGTALVAARATALPEVVDDAAVLVAPDDVDGWASSLRELLGDPDRRAALGAAGRARAEAYSIERSSAALVAAYGGAAPPAPEVP